MNRVYTHFPTAQVFCDNIREVTQLKLEELPPFKTNHHSHINYGSSLLNLSSDAYRQSKKNRKKILFKVFFREDIKIFIGDTSKS